MKRPPVTDTQAAAFIAACLDPVPLGKKTLVCRMLARESRRQARERWYIAWREVEHFYHLHEAMNSGRMVCLTRGEKTDMDEAAIRPPLRAAVDRMMLLPAPTRFDLGRKRRWRRWAGDEKAAARAIAADEARLGGIA